MFSKLLVCVDGSDCAEHASRTALDIAEKFGAEVVLVNVANPAPLAVPIMVGGEAVLDAAGIETSVIAVQKSILANARDVFEQEGVFPRMRAEMGQPVEGIVRAAKEENADLVVLGSRGLGGFQRLLLGSVSDAVLHHSHCPVMIVR